MTSPAYIVICGSKEPYVVGRHVKDMGREETIRQIASGEWTNVSSIIEIGDKDVTQEFAMEVMQRWALNDEPLDDWQREFIELHVGIRAANAFAQAAE